MCGAFDLDHADAAGVGRSHRGPVTEGGDVRTRLTAGVENGGALGDFDLGAIDPG